MDEKQEIIKVKKNKGSRNFIPIIIALIVGAAVMYLLYSILPIEKAQTIINKSEKEVTVGFTSV